MTASSPSAILSLSNLRPCPILFPLTSPVSDSYAAGKWERKKKGKKHARKNSLITSVLTSTLARHDPSQNCNCRKIPGHPTYTGVSSVKCNLSGNKLLRS